MRGTAMASTRRIVAWLIVVCVLIESCLLAADIGLIPISRLRARVYEYGGFWPGLLNDWRPNYPQQAWVMFLSYGVFHAGPLHLVVNMLALHSLGDAIGERVGGYRFLLLFCVSALGGGLGFALLSDSYRPMVGASGALFGLAGALLIWDYADRVTLQERVWPVARAAALLAALNVALYFAMGGLLAWEAHLGGFVAGALTALVIGQRPLE